jgi:cobalt-zinc-cadmium efflux system outer membrane protein
LLIALHSAALSAAAASSATAPAQATLDTPSITLSQVFEQAWQRHPVLQSLPDRRAASSASLQAAQAWTAQVPSLDIRTQDDRIGSDRGAREWEAGVVLPLWLPGQRARSLQLAEGEALVVDAYTAQARLALAGQVREAWWAWHRANAELALAEARVVHAQTLLADVRRRVQAGDLARSDQHQADGLLASAMASQAQAQAQRSQAWQMLAAWIPGQGLREPTAAPAQSEAMAPAAPQPTLDIETHPLVRVLAAQAKVARQSAELAATQARANPELTLGTVQGRDQRGEGYQRALTLGLKLPLGSSPTQAAQAAKARADASEIEAQLALVRIQVEQSVAGAHTRLMLARTLQEATRKRALLAKENQAFFDKSFQLGETDLPTRLRIDLEAQEAERQDALARIEVSAATSALRQAEGLLPQ